MPKPTLNPKEITQLLSKLKDTTPEYPADLLEARKAAFLKHASTINLPGKGSGGAGGQGGSGGPGVTPGGGPAAPGFLMQALIGLGLVAALLSAAFLYHNQINDLLAGNGIQVVSVESPPTPADIPATTPPVTASLLPTVASPEPSTSSTATPPTGTATAPATIVVNGTPVVGSTPVIADIPDGTPVVGSTPVIVDIPDGTQGNNGLHLGQTPGAPAAPGQGNPGNVNQPDNPGNSNSGNDNSGNGNSGNGNSGNGNSGNGNPGFYYPPSR